MAIQILGLREYTDKKSGKKRKAEKFFEKNWRFTAVDELLKDPMKVLVSVPESEQFNLYFTVADCFEETGRKLKEQWVIPFDVDNLAGLTEAEVTEQAQKVALKACEALGVLYNQTGVIFSGHGVQLFVKMVRPILSEDYFENFREHYRSLCDKIQLKLTENGLQGNVDTSVFSPARLMRMPLTMNIKDGKPKRRATVLQGSIEAVGFDIVERSGLDSVTKADQIHPDIIKKYPKPDNEAVLSECEFLKHCFANPNEIKEPEWYAGIGVVAFLENGKELCHTMSQGHRGYDQYETELKIDQTLRSAGPRTCKDINTRWSGCKTCKHYGSKLVSPILIHGPNYIKTETLGFREIAFDSKGNAKKGPVAYDDLIKKFQKQFGDYFCTKDAGQIYVFKDTHWVYLTRLEVEGWAAALVDPSASTHETNEFFGRLKQRMVRDFEEIVAQQKGYMNFKNGVLKLDTLELLPHKPTYGFMNVLPYSYDRTAKAPMWEKYLSDVTNGDAKLAQLLEEFGGYAIAGGECLTGKAIFLIGEGANGKSVYAETLAQVVGDHNCSKISLTDLAKENARALLVNKFFNYSDETAETAFKDTDVFKKAVTGSKLTAKFLYVNTVEFSNKAKFVILANDLPPVKDLTDGMRRRMVIVNFTKQFFGAADNKMLKYDMWEQEKAGICNRLIEGFKQLEARKFLFDEPESVKNSLIEYFEESNPAFDFSRERITADNTSKITSQELYAEYVIWADAMNVYKISPQKLTKSLKKIPEFKHCNFSVLTKVDGRPMRCIEGLKLKPKEI